MEVVREYFDRIAPQWDRLRADYFSEDVRTEVLSRAELQPHAEVADVGCGTGFLAAGLAPRAARVHCIDASAAMLAEAERNLRSFANVHFHVADGASLPLAEGSVEAAVANMYLHHCPDPARALREMVRILKPGGVLVLADLSQHQEVWMRTEMADLWLGFDREAVRAWLAEAGLVEISVDSPGHR